MSYNNNDNFYDNDFSSRQTFDDSIVSIFSKPEATITGIFHELILDAHIYLI